MPGRPLGLNHREGCSFVESQKKVYYPLDSKTSICAVSGRGHSPQKPVATRRASPHNAMFSETLSLLGSPQCKQPEVALLVLAYPALSSA